MNSVRCGVFAALLICLAFSAPLLAQPAGWSGIGAFDIRNDDVASVTDYEAPLTFNGATLVTAGALQAQGQDLRFASDAAGTSPLAYWIDGPINSATARVWVHVPTLPSTSTTRVYLFYGNPGAPAMTNAAATLIGHIYSGNGDAAPVSPGGVTNSQRGFQFVPTADVLLMQVGKNEPNGTTRYVTLFDFATQAILRQSQIAGPPAMYAYTAVEPLWLTQNSHYIIEMYQGDTDGYYFASPPTAGPHITYVDMRYCNGCTQNTFPTNIIGGQHYGLVDFKYARPPTLDPMPVLTMTDIADHAIILDDGRSDAGPGQPVTYTMIVANNSLLAATGTQVSMPVPAQVSAMSHTATATGGATGFTASGTGAISDTVTLPGGATITYTVTAIVGKTATGSLVATASVLPADGGIELEEGDEVSTDTDVILQASIFADGFEN